MGDERQAWQIAIESAVREEEKKRMPLLERAIAAETALRHERHISANLRAGTAEMTAQRDQAWKHLQALQKLPTVELDLAVRR